MSWNPLLLFKLLVSITATVSPDRSFSAVQLDTPFSVMTLERAVTMDRCVTLGASGFAVMRIVWKTPVLYQFIDKHLQWLNAKKIVKKVSRRVTSAT